MRITIAMCSSALASSVEISSRLYIVGNSSSYRGFGDMVLVSKPENLSQDMALVFVGNGLRSQESDDEKRDDLQGAGGHGIFGAICENHPYRDNLGRPEIMEPW